jgi:predicted PurR-regulated permease PerM
MVASQPQQSEEHGGMASRNQSAEYYCLDKCAWRWVATSAISAPDHADCAVRDVTERRMVGDRTLAAADLLLGDPGERLASKTADAIRGTVSGLAAAAVIDGTVVGIAYVLAGVPHPLLFAVLTTAFAMVPFDAWVALTAAVLILLLTGGTLWGSMGLFGIGAGVLLAVDNFIQPALVGGTARLPFLLALIGTLGGLQSLGLVGVFLGPVVMAPLVTVWREWVGVGHRSDRRAPA